MTKEEKNLLLQDLCARLPYGLLGRDCFGKTRQMVVIYDTGTVIAQEIDGVCCSACGFVPYLRPMSSMTEEEMGEYAKFRLFYDDVYKFTDFRTTGKGFINAHTSCKNGGCGYTFQVNNRTMLYDGIIGIDWLNANHFDYRGLIEKGLALPAKENMYND